MGDHQKIPYIQGYVPRWTIAVILVTLARDLFLTRVPYESLRELTPGGRRKNAAGRRSIGIRRIRLEYFCADPSGLGDRRCPRFDKSRRRGNEDWSLTSLQQRLVKTGGRLVKHARYYWLFLAEGHLNRRRFGAMLGRIALLPVPTG